MKNEIIVINDKKMTLAEIFVPNGVDKIIAEIKEKANNFVPDMTTKQGREEIASFAYKIAKTKTILDKAGKSLLFRPERIRGRKVSRQEVSQPRRYGYLVSFHQNISGRSMLDSKPVFHQISPNRQPVLF